MLILSFLCRLAAPTAASGVVSELAMIASLLVVVTGVITQRISLRRDAAPDRQERRDPDNRRDSRGVRSTRS